MLAMDTKVASDWYDMGSSSAVGGLVMYRYSPIDVRVLHNVHHGAKHVHFKKHIYEEAIEIWGASWLARPRVPNGSRG